MRLADMSFGRNSASRKGAPPAARRRSLHAALAEAGLAEPETEVSPPVAKRMRGLDAAVAERASIFSNPRVEVSYAAPRPEPVPQAPMSQPPMSQPPMPRVSEPVSRRSPPSVVSPPPWMRAARRGRWQSRMQNTFGWVVTLAIVGGIVGFAGHFLGVPPMGSATIQATASR